MLCDFYFIYRFEWFNTILSKIILYVRLLNISEFVVDMWCKCILPCFNVIKRSFSFSDYSKFMSNIFNKNHFITYNFSHSINVIIILLFKVFKIWNIFLLLSILNAHLIKEFHFKIKNT